MHKRMTLLALITVLALLLVAQGVLVAADFAAGAETAVSNSTISRPHDPVVITGSQLSVLQGTAVTDLVLYAYVTSTWQPVPFQIDEVDGLGNFVAQEDGLLDANDQLVFMGDMAGAWVSATTWISDETAVLSPRYAITVTNPLSPAQMGWVYLYRSTTLPRSAAQFVTWDEAAQTVTAVSYTLSFDPQNFLGIADMSLNGTAVDVLDRQKLRATATLYIGPIPIGSQELTEESILNFITTPVTISLPIAGPIRAVGGNVTQQFTLYGARADLAISLPVGQQVVPGLPGTTFAIDALRASLDLLDPAATGLAPAAYYDANTPAGVPVDGTPDVVPPSPLVSWQQLDGHSGGFVMLTDISLDSGTVTNFYMDDGTLDPADTGDGRSFGDTGFAIADPDGILTIQQSIYFLAGEQGNQGSTAQAWAANPLTAVTEAQWFDAGGTAVYLPLLIRQ
ncbi:MAG: hypothetical protein R3E31_25115 [Chloroflexota bacterium]